MGKGKGTFHVASPGESLAFSDVRTPGCYVARASGDLFRVPEQALAEGDSSHMKIVSEPPKVVTKIADDPWVPINKARRLAADADLFVSF